MPHHCGLYLPALIHTGTPTTGSGYGSASGSSALPAELQETSYEREEEANMSQETKTVQNTDSLFKSFETASEREEDEDGSYY